MKKFLCLVLGLVLLTSLVACGKKDAPDNEVLQPEPDLPSVSYELSALNEPLVIDTDQLVKITLKDLKANFNGPVIHIKNANGVQIYLEGQNDLVSTGDKETATILAETDLTFFGTGTLDISSVGSCIQTSGNLFVMNGTFYLKSGKTGYGMCADETMVINSGKITSTGSKCLEATQVLLNNGTVNLESNSIAIRAVDRVKSLKPKFTLNGGKVTIKMTDSYTYAIESTGEFAIHNGTLDIDAKAAFCWKNVPVFDGGTVIVAGVEIEELNNYIEAIESTTDLEDTESNTESNESTQTTTPTDENTNTGSEGTTNTEETTNFNETTTN